jgi:hypothetical protein
MTKFANELRHYCRNSNCRTKLPEPTANLRRAFCTRGCHAQFYRNRCLVCENELPPGRSDRKLCRRPKCRREYRQNKVLFETPKPKSGSDTVRAHLASKNPDKTGTFFEVSTAEDGALRRMPASGGYTTGKAALQSSFSARQTATSSSSRTSSRSNRRRRLRTPIGWPKPSRFGRCHSIPTPRRDSAPLTTWSEFDDRRHGGDPTFPTLSKARRWPWSLAAFRYRMS